MSRTRARSLACSEALSYAAPCWPGGGGWRCAELHGDRGGFGHLRERGRRRQTLERGAPRRSRVIGRGVEGPSRAVSPPWLIGLARGGEGLAECVGDGDGDAVVPV